MYALCLSNVSHRFAGGWVLAHLQLQVAQGSRVLLTGNNGSGKTTLLRLMATALRPTRGSVRVFGHDAEAAPQACRRRLTLMTHQHHFYEALTGRDNLALVARLRGLAPSRAPIGVAAALAQVGLAAAAHRAVATYSAGMVRRLALARVLLLAPELVLLDEPFAQLDASGLAIVEDVLAAMAARGTTWVMSTHDGHRAQALCNDHVHLQAGQATGVAFAGPWAGMAQRQERKGAPA